MRRSRPLKICLDARVGDGESGGVQQVIIGLATAFSELDGPEEYLFLTRAGQDEWLRPYLAGKCATLPAALSPPPTLMHRLARSFGRQLPATAMGSVARLARPLVPVPCSDGTIERGGVDVVHFTTQDAYLTGIPSIFQLHDLQHLHFPEFFDAATFAKRERLNQTFCDRAAVVAVMTHWGKDDLVSRYRLAPDKVHVVPWAPILGAYPEPRSHDLAEMRKRLAHPDGFILYPAQTWPHKGHMVLLDALSQLRERRGVVVPLVCSGRQTEFFQRIDQKVRDLHLSDQVTFVGFVEPVELRALYVLARAVVFPSLFEGWGMPVTEAFAAGRPVACSDLPVLREQAANAALFFAPSSSTDLADAIAQVWTNEELRVELVERGLSRVADLSWDSTARTFRAHYRRLAGAPLTSEDEELLTPASAALELAS